MSSTTNSDLIDELFDYTGRTLVCKFSRMGHSLLLRLQSELATLEQQAGQGLVAHIALQKRGAPETTIDREESARQDALARKITEKYLTYYTLLDLFIRIQATRPPEQAVLDSFETIYKKHVPGGEIKDSSWASPHDVVGPFTQHLNPDVLTCMILRWINSFRNKGCFRAYTKGRPLNVDTQKLSSLLSFVVVTLVPTLIAGPMFALNAISSNWWRIAGLWAFTIIFGVVASFLTGKNVDLIFMSSAAFCSVLSVFVGTSTTGPAAQ